MAIAQWTHAWHAVSARGPAPVAPVLPAVRTLRAGSISPTGGGAALVDYTEHAVGVLFAGYVIRANKQVTALHGESDKGDRFVFQKKKKAVGQLDREIGIK